MSKFVIDKRAPFFFFLSCFLVLIVANRGDTPDTFVYYYIFNHIDSYNLKSFSDFYSATGVELGYGWYAYIVSLLTNSENFLFGLYSAINFLMLYLILRKFNKKITVLSLLIYASGPFFFMQQFMQMRQGLAVLLALYAIIALFQDRKFSTFIIFSGLAMMMHQVSIALISLSFLFYVFFNKIEISKRNFLLLAIPYFFILTFLFKYVFVSVLMGVSGRLEDYYYSSYNYSIGILSLPNLKSYLLCIFVLFFSKKEMYLNRYFVFLMFLLITSVACRIGFSDFAILSGRFSTVFGFVEVILFPFIMYELFNNKVWVYISIFIISICQLYITLNFQAPYLIDNYFTPLY